MKISLCMIVKNEEKYIAQCLKSVALLVDEIIIVDTGSTDNTITIANEYQAKIFQHPWENDFGKARNYSLAQATGDWILVLDADESLYIEDIQKLKDILQRTKANGIGLKFHNFIDEGSEENYNTHMGVRIFKNHYFHYQGAIHEQLLPINNTIAIDIETTDVRVRHFGYLKSNSGKKKRERNIPIIQKLLDKNPQDSFQLFNMGNEYMSDDDYNKALFYFEKAYENKDVTLAYCPHLIFRRAICLNYLKRNEESLAILGEGIMLYPKCIDYEYLRGRIYKSHKKYTLAIESFEKCISSGAAPLNLTFLSDTEGFRSFVELGHIYFLQDDYPKALSYYLKALGLKNNHYELLYKSGELLNKMHPDKAIVGASLEKLFADGYYINNVLVIVDVLLKERLYPQAAEYFKRIENQNVFIEDIQYLKGRLLFYQKDYENAFDAFINVLKSENHMHLLPEVQVRSLEYAVICYLASKQNDQLQRLSPLIEGMKDEERKQVFLAFMNKTEVIFASSAKPGIYRILSEILQISEFELFEQSLSILNQIDSNEVLLDLANIYYINGYKEMALKNIMRSVKELDVLNANAVQILNKEFLLPE
ncbi:MULTISPECIES: TPR domain-containing glycosyltransferase [Anaerotignum]|uniref:TPR domain-containing glycosyltransferase n=1 Tax=Anaerotignum TaxID=2039240 RepID=UPI00210ED004|nr:MULTISPECIES: TPR domain-containing glycosyltransferase [Anaerotignum]MCQ4937340.1 glycosyltransferase [Anaerotignum propionicum]